MESGNHMLRYENKSLNGSFSPYDSLEPLKLGFVGKGKGWGDSATLAYVGDCHHQWGEWRGTSDANFGKGGRENLVGNYPF